MTLFNSKWKYNKISRLLPRSVHDTELCSFPLVVSIAEDDKEMYKDYNARAQPLFFSLNFFSVTLSLPSPFFFFGFFKFWRCLAYSRWERAPSKILKLGAKEKHSSFSKILWALFLRFWHFWRENDVTNLAPNFDFSNMGYLMLLFERTFYKDLKTEKKLKYEHQSKEKTF